MSWGFWASRMQGSGSLVSIIRDEIGYCSHLLLQVDGLSQVERNDAYPLLVSLSPAHPSCSLTSPQVVSVPAVISCIVRQRPRILFLGLDAYNAFNVVECLVTLARDYKRTVIFTIHQPRSNIVSMFDHLIVLSMGKMVYSGEFFKCQDYFAGIGEPCPPGFNIADFLSECQSTKSDDEVLRQMQTSS